MTAMINREKMKTFLDELDRVTPLEIQGNGYWFKVVEFLQTNWALVDEQANGRATIWFINDNSGVFDSMVFDSLEAAVHGLMKNGFDLFSEELQARAFLVPPSGPFKFEPHPNGRIYSGGKFWRP